MRAPSAIRETSEGEDAVEVVEAVVGFVAGEDEQAAEHHLDEDRDLGGAQQYQKGTEERSRYQAIPPMAKATRLSTMTAQPTTR